MVWYGMVACIGTLPPTAVLLTRCTTTAVLLILVIISLAAKVLHLDILQLWEDFILGIYSGNHRASIVAIYPLETPAYFLLSGNTGEKGANRSGRSKYSYPPICCLDQYAIGSSCSEPPLWQSPTGEGHDGNGRLEQRVASTRKHINININLMRDKRCCRCPIFSEPPSARHPVIMSPGAK